MECHYTDSVVCTAETSQLSEMGNNCIACHMPTMPSNSMTVELGEDSPETPFYVRTHLIKVYPEELRSNQYD